MLLMYKCTAIHCYLEYISQKRCLKKTWKGDETDF